MAQKSQHHCINFITICIEKVFAAALVPEKMRPAVRQDAFLYRCYAKGTVLLLFFTFAGYRDRALPVIMTANIASRIAPTPKPIQPFPVTPAAR